MVSEQCSVCQHPESDNINAQLVHGATLKSLAQRFGLGVMALSRHRKNHLPMIWVHDESMDQAVSTERLLERVMALYQKAWDLMITAETESKINSAVSALREARHSLELVAKLDGQLKTGTHLSIIYNKEWIDLRTTIYNALVDYPEARLKLAESLSEVIEAEVIEE